MADTPKRVIRLIDNIKLELYEGNRKKYVYIWDPTGNNTYNEDDKGPSGISSPERSKKFQSAESDDDVIHNAIISSQIVEYYLIKGKRNSQSGKSEYFKYLQDPFSETPPTKRIYGGGGLGTPEVDKVGPTPYYLNNGCEINIKWTGRVPNPDFKLGTFSTPSETQQYNESLNPEGPPRWLYDQPILSDIDEVDSEKNTTLRPKSEWVLEKGGYDPDFGSKGKTYSTNYRDEPSVEDKFVSITLPIGFTENGGKGYLDWVGSTKPLVYSTFPKGTTSFLTGINGRGEGITEERNVSVLNNFNSYTKDEDILKTIITGYKSQVADVYKFINQNEYDLKVCFPDTGTCSLIPYKSPLVNLSEVGSTPSVVEAVPVLTPKKVKLNVFGLPGVTSLSGETDGSIKIKAKVSLPDFTVYLGDPKGSTVSDATGLNPFGLVEDEVENPDPYEETGFLGQEESLSLELEGISQADPAVVSTANEINKTPYVPSGKHKLDLVPGNYRTNGGDKIQICCIDGKPVNVKIADAYLDMYEAAKSDGVILSINSAFRSPYDSINATSESGKKVSASSQQYLYDGWIAKKPGFNLAAAPGGSNHGWGIGLDLNAGGKSSGRYIGVDTAIYTWLVKNSWRFGFIRAVASEEWHYDYLPDLAKKGPYGKLSAKDTGSTDTKFYHKNKSGSNWNPPLDELNI